MSNQKQKEIVGHVTEEEKQIIEKLFERKLALGELMQTICSPSFAIEEKDNAYERIVNDMGKTTLEFNAWWDDKASKYKWKSCANRHWHIDFATNEIFILND